MATYTGDTHTLTVGFSAGPERKLGLVENDKPAYRAPLPEMEQRWTYPSRHQLGRFLAALRHMLRVFKPTYSPPKVEGIGTLLEIGSSSSTCTDLNRGPEPSGPSRISQVCRHSFLPEAGVAARRATLYPTGQKFLTSWKTGCRYSMRPNDSTACQDTVRKQLTL